jgi:lipopolysaccharide transport system ATP-binding protein
MSSEIAISVQNVSKRYEMYDSPRDRLKQFVLPRVASLAGATKRDYFREFWALQDISLEVKKGEAVGIVGRNGSGKSTLLQIITGVLSPTTGTVQTHGRIAALLELGSGFNTDYTGRENVYLNGALLGLSKDEIDAKFDDIASFADIGEHLDQPVKTYSSGMLVRLAFAVQVQVQPDILIVDEALAVGDALFQKRCFQQIERLVSDGVSLLFVSHDQESVRTLTNRALLLQRGRKLAWGLSSEVILRYRRLLHEEEAAYFASITERIAKNAASAPPPQPINQDDRVGLDVSPVQEEGVREEAASGVRSAAMSFGSGEVRVLSVATLDATGSACAVFYPGDRVTVRVACRVEARVENISIGVRIRNKEGFKVYSWGTLNQDMKRLAGQQDGGVFWERSFEKGDECIVDFVFDCALGVNLYEIQASVTHEDRPDYTSQRTIHWVDEAAFFQVLMRRDEHFFGGVVDLRMEATW